MIHSQVISRFEQPNTRWKTLPEDDDQGIFPRSFTVSPDGSNIHRPVSYGVGHSEADYSTCYSRGKLELISYPMPRRSIGIEALMLEYHLIQ